MNKNIEKNPLNILAKHTSANVIESSEPSLSEVESSIVKVVSSSYLYSTP